MLFLSGRNRLRLISIWILALAGALLAGAFLTRYGLATPKNEGYYVDTTYPLPADPLGLASKWFIASAFLLAGGIALWFKSRTSGQQMSVPTGNAMGKCQILCLVLLVSAGIGVVCSVELSSTEWTKTGWMESPDEIKPELKEDPHTFFFDSATGSSSVMIIRIIPRNTTTKVFALLGSPEANEAAREGIRDYLNRRNMARISWLITGMILVFLIFTSKKCLQT